MAESAPEKKKLLEMSARRGCPADAGAIRFQWAPSAMVETREGHPLEEIVVSGVVAIHDDQRSAMAESMPLPPQIERLNSSAKRMKKAA